MLFFRGLRSLLNFVCCTKLQNCEKQRKHFRAYFESYFCLLNLSEILKTSAKSFRSKVRRVESLQGVRFSRELSKRTALCSENRRRKRSNKNASLIITIVLKTCSKRILELVVPACRHLSMYCKNSS